MPWDYLESERLAKQKLASLPSSCTGKLKLDASERLDTTLVGRRPVPIDCGRRSLEQQVSVCTR